MSFWNKINQLSEDLVPDPVKEPIIGVVGGGLLASSSSGPASEAAR